MIVSASTADRGLADLREHYAKTVSEDRQDPINSWNISGDIFIISDGISITIHRNFSSRGCLVQLYLKEQPSMYYYRLSSGLPYHVTNKPANDSFFIAPQNTPILIISPQHLNTCLYRHRCLHIPQQVDPNTDLKPAIL